MPFDLILLDLYLKGYSILKDFKDLSSSSIVKKIILVTASTIIDDEIQCHQFGLRDFIRKPFNIKLSRVIIEKHLLAILDANYTLEIHGPFSVNLEKREMSLEDEVLDLSFGQFTIFYTP